MDLYRFMLRKWIYLLFLAVVLYAKSSYAGAVEEVKAAIALRIPSYIKWIDEDKSKQQNKREICVLGQTDLIWPESTDLQRNIKIIKNADFLETCDIVFIGKNQSDGVREIVKKLGSKKILTVSDMEGFSDMGGMIELLQLDNRIGIALNMDVSQEAGFDVSSMIRVCERIYKQGRWIRLRK